ATWANAGASDAATDLVRLVHDVRGRRIFCRFLRFGCQLLLADANVALAAACGLRQEAPDQEFYRSAQRTKHIEGPAPAEKHRDFARQREADADADKLAAKDGAIYSRPLFGWEEIADQRGDGRRRRSRDRAKQHP